VVNFKQAKVGNYWLAARLKEGSLSANKRWGTGPEGIKPRLDSRFAQGPRLGGSRPEKGGQIIRAAIYARYSSENQRPESIEDQVAACRRLAAERRFGIVEDHMYADQARSGARKDREGLTSLIATAQNQRFGVVLVDDLSRLARDNYLMLSVLAELHFAGVRVISVADGLKKKTLRGQIGQKQREFSVGERTYGYKSVPVASSGSTRRTPARAVYSSIFAVSGNFSGCSIDSMPRSTSRSGQ